MEPQEPFVDIHCHILCGMDNGAVDMGQSLAMARMAAADGIRTVIATPHQLGAYSHNTAEAIRSRASQLHRLLVEQSIRLEVLPGAELRMEHELVERIKAGDVLTLADRARHVLLELPHEMQLPVERLLEDLARAGLVPILSHPERNLGLLENPQIVSRLVSSGCLMQVTAASLVGGFGHSVKRFAERLVARGLVHFVATDAHSITSRRPLMRRAFERLALLAGLETAHELCCRNPLRVSLGEEVPRGLGSSRLLTRRAG